MSPGDGPTLGEVVRRLEDVVTQLASLAAQLQQLPRELDEKYLRRETYLVKTEAQDKAIMDLEDSRRTLSRVAWSGIAVPLLLIIIAALSGLAPR